MKLRTALFSILTLSLFSVTAHAGDGELLESYTAYLGEKDHFNSYGERLKSAAAIVRQDRANYHRFGVRDEDDQSDSFFSNARNRDLLEQWLNRGTIDQSLANRIVYGNPVIHVRIYGYGRNVEYITVSAE